MNTGQFNQRPSPQLHLSCELESSDLVVCRVIGIITRDALDGEACELCEHSAKNLLLDLSQVQQIDSAGVSWLIRLHQTCGQAGGRLVMHSVSLVVCRTFNLLNMRAIFVIAENEQTVREVAMMNSK